MQGIVCLIHEHMAPSHPRCLMRAEEGQIEGVVRGLANGGLITRYEGGDFFAGMSVAMDATGRSDRAEALFDLADTYWVEHAEERLLEVRNDEVSDSDASWGEPWPWGDAEDAPERTCHL
jgi:hypothetical protein